MDLLTLFGIIIALLAILVGQFLEGGHLSSLLNFPAMLIVVGGTLGAAMVETSLQVFIRAINISVWVISPPKLDFNSVINKIVHWSRLVRKGGLLVLENALEEETDPFIAKGLGLLVDGSEPHIIRDILELEIDSKINKDSQAAKFFESMGGYAPTIGIIGAVLGLIHVMSNLADPSKLGAGIAVAFVATIYGVGSANILFLPIAIKLKNIVMKNSLLYEMIVEGLMSIAEGDNPRMIELKLQGFNHE